jgi:UDP-2,4-diacetamido-2,4,6-trideoxy-beta-L-altropyranose hydrolase
LFKKTLLIRADASLQIGFGHVLRCLALAQAWQDAGGEAIFVCAELPEMLEARLAKENFSVETIETSIGSRDDALQTQKIARDRSANWVVCDGYRFDGDWLRNLRSDEFALLVLNDFSSVDLSVANTILNPNAGAKADMYARFVANSQVLAGADFALLRREFRWQKRVKKRVPKEIERVLVAMGGADLKNLVPRALSWLQSQGFTGKVVILSGAREFDLPKFGFDLKIVSAQNEVSDWMNWCDLALAAAGSTTWELACCGVPTILSVVADNQHALSLWAHQNGVALSLGQDDKGWEKRLGTAWQILGSSVARERMSMHARNSIDGQGGARVVQKLWSDALQLRRAEPEDARILWEWRNDAQTRAMSLQSDFIEWEQHRAWMQTRLEDENSEVWIALKNGEPVGSVRFASVEMKATISVVLAPQWRGLGLGCNLIEMGCRVLFRLWDVSIIRALIKSENVASRRAFSKAGFCCATSNSSMPYLEFLLERPA